jgi:hypothetical protein
VEQVLPRGESRGVVAQIIYTHVEKCKNNKINIRKAPRVLSHTVDGQEF